MTLVAGCVRQNDHCPCMHSMARHVQACTPPLIRQSAEAYQGTLLVQGKRSYTFTLKDGRKVKGSDLVKVDNWAWSYSLHAPGCRYVRLRARSRTYGQVVLVVVDKPGEKPFYLISMSLSIHLRRSFGKPGSRGTYAAPAFNTPNMETMNSRQRSMHKATRVSGPTPKLLK